MCAMSWSGRRLRESAQRWCRAYDRHGRHASARRRAPSVSRRGRAARGRGGRRGRSAGTRRGRRVRASRCTTTVHGPMPGSASSFVGQLVAVDAGVDDDRLPSASAAHMPMQRASCGRRHRQLRRGRARRSRRRSGMHASGRRPARRAVRRSPATSRAGERPGADDGHLLAEHGAHGELGRRRREPASAGRACRDERGERRIGAEHRVDGDGIGVEVEQPPAALHRGLQVAPVVEAQLALDVAGRAARSATVPCRAAGVSTREYVVPSHASTPGTARTPRNVEASPSASNGTRCGSCTVTAPGRPARGRAANAARTATTANTSRTVSLNWRTLENPAANAIVGERHRRSSRSAAAPSERAAAVRARAGRRPSPR